MSSIQSFIREIEGSPEGVLRAPVGTLVVDKVLGRLFQKKTVETLSTGWSEMVDSSGSASSSVAVVSTIDDMKDLTAVAGVANNLKIAVVEAPDPGYGTIYRYKLGGSDDADGLNVINDNSSLGQFVVIV